MTQHRFSHLGAVLQALLVTFLWSTSWVLIKIGLADIPAITFAGLRYGLAFLCLLPFALRPGRLAPLRSLSRGAWARLVALGLLFYAVTQGAQFLGLAYLPSVTVSLLLNFTTVAVALMGIPLLAERPTVLQWSGVFLNVAGIVTYFYPVAIPAHQAVGLTVVVIGVLANAGSAILGRRVNRAGDVPPLTVTVVSMGIGAVVLLGFLVWAFGFAVELTADTQKSAFRADPANKGKFIDTGLGPGPATPITSVRSCCGSVWRSSRCPSCGAGSLSA